MNTRHAVCTRNTGHEASLFVGKLYEVVTDSDADNDGMIRVIDEDGEDYLFEADMFYPLAIPQDLTFPLHVQS